MCSFISFNNFASRLFKPSIVFRAADNLVDNSRAAWAAVAAAVAAVLAAIEVGDGAAKVDAEAFSLMLCVTVGDKGPETKGASFCLDGDGEMVDNVLRIEDAVCFVGD